MKIEVKKISAISDFIDVLQIRIRVFVMEQKFSADEEFDEEDKTALHYLASMDGKGLATLRVVNPAPKEYRIERVATDKAARGKGIGQKLIEGVLKDLLLNNPHRIWLRSQAQVQKFYEKSGFRVCSKPYTEHDIPHIDMEYPI